MSIYLLNEEIIFPDPKLADAEGLLAIGGDLSVERLLLAYKNGIFPWFEDDEQILWWSPDPRLIMKLNDFKLSKSLRRVIKSQKFQIKFNTRFVDVVNACAEIKRQDEFGTWITDGMKKAYKELHQKGHAHSVEVYADGQMVGGLYGLVVGKVFCGESMFHTVSNASKVALYYLVDWLKTADVSFIDAQTPTEHLKSMGAIEISRAKFLGMLEDNF